MKAVVIHEFSAYDQAGLGALDDPVPGPGEVVVDLEASDVNFPDILYIEGTYQAIPSRPFSPGLAGAGRVSARGASVEGLALGEKVLVLPKCGTYAEKVLAQASHCFPVPEDMPSCVAAAFGLVYQTAYFALTERARMRAGDNVLVLGASGGVGMASVQLAKALGAGRVIAATRGEAGAAFAGDVGADVVFDSGRSDLKDGLKSTVADATNGYGVDVVIDGVGGDLSAAALRTLAWCGRLVVVGFASGDISKISANYLLVKNIEVNGLQWTDYRERCPSRVHQAQAHLFTLWRAGRLAPRITRTLPLERFAEALAGIKNAQSPGKTILLTGR